MTRSLAAFCLAFAMLAAPAFAQAAYTTYFRYDGAQRIVGVISADPDGTVPA